LQAELDARELAALKGQNNGYASLDAAGKVPADQLPSSVMEYKGTWDAATNTPTLTTGDPGDVYRVSVAGTQFGIQFRVSDYVIFNGTAWERSPGAEGVSSVPGLSGDVGAAALVVALGVVDNNDPRLTDHRHPTQAGQVADMSVIVFGASTVREVGAGDNPFGVKVQRDIDITKVTFRCATADGSDGLVAALFKNDVEIAGSSVTIPVASQLTGASATGKWTIAADDVLTAKVKAVGGTPGNGLVVDIKGVTT
jgi:hypothetical protein